MTRDYDYDRLSGSYSVLTKSSKVLPLVIRSQLDKKIDRVVPLRSRIYPTFDVLLENPAKEIAILFPEEIRP